MSIHRQRLQVRVGESATPRRVSVQGLRRRRLQRHSLVFGAHPKVMQYNRQQPRGRIMGPPFLLYSCLGLLNLTVAM